MSYEYGHCCSPTQWAIIPPPSSTYPPLPSSTRKRGMTRTASEIIPRLYISDLSFAESPSLLSSCGITHILSTLSDKVHHPPPSVLPNQPIRLQIRLDDTPFSELAENLPTTTSWIRNALAAHPEARVLVHCVEGISRSVSVVAAFLMAQNEWSVETAVEFVKSKRTIANPNFGFVQQLDEYGRESLGRVDPPIRPTVNTALLMAQEV